MAKLVSDEPSKVSARPAKTSNLAKIGVFGGTFDPIHAAHVHCAEAAMRQFDLDKVLFIPASRPSFKLGKPLSDISCRLEMCELAIDGYPNFEVSDIEAMREGTSFTIDTIKDLANGEYANAKLYFIIGSDAFILLDQWKSWKDLIHLTDFIVIMRDEDDVDQVLGKAKEMGASIHVANGERSSISSSYVRDSIIEGRPYRDLLIDSVADYIEEKGLYRGQEA